MEKKKRAEKKTAPTKGAGKKRAPRTAEEKRTAGVKASQKKTPKKKAAKKAAEKKGPKPKQSAQKKTGKRRAPRKAPASRVQRENLKGKKKKEASAQDRASVRNISDVPQGYNEDALVIMPVNSDTSFIYWEITEDRLKVRKKKSRGLPSKLMMRVFENRQEREIYSFEVVDMVGRHYMKHRGSGRPLVAEIGLLRGKTFTSLLKSNPAAVSSSASGGAGGAEIWMKKEGDAFELIRISAAELRGDPGLRRLLMKYSPSGEVFWSGSSIGSMFLPIF